jgi:hypothetical protein
MITFYYLIQFNRIFSHHLKYLDFVMKFIYLKLIFIFLIFETIIYSYLNRINVMLATHNLYDQLGHLYFKIQYFHTHLKYSKSFQYLLDLIQKEGFLYYK